MFVLRNTRDKNSKISDRNLEFMREILEIINKLMNLSLNDGLISLNTAPSPQNIFLMIIEKHILII